MHRVKLKEDENSFCGTQTGVKQAYRLLFGVYAMFHANKLLPGRTQIMSSQVLL